MTSKTEKEVGWVSSQARMGQLEGTLVKQRELCNLFPVLHCVCFVAPSLLPLLPCAGSHDNAVIPRCPLGK